MINQKIPYKRCTGIIYEVINEENKKKIDGFRCKSKTNIRCAFCQQPICGSVLCICSCLIKQTSVELIEEALAVRDNLNKHIDAMIAITSRYYRIRKHAIKLRGELSDKLKKAPKNTYKLG